MGNPSTAHEPSMEEILASIRQIISEDGESPAAIQAGSEQPAVGEEEPAPEVTAERFAPEAASEDEGDQFAGDYMKPKSSFGAATSTHGEAEPFEDAVYRRQFPSQSDAGAAQTGRGGGAIISEESDAVISGAFGALAHTILAQNARTLEDLVAEMLKPMLKEWLDDNLPPLVERLVQEEIQRVSRGRR
ncbi:MAG TPA: DUF2497 domain-containing protein [Propylenella sp.]